MVSRVELEENTNYILYRDGRLYSKRSKKFLKPIQTKRSDNHRYAWGHTGYPKYSINCKLMSIHRLLGKYFIPNPENKPLVLHLDDDCCNWNLNNLQWGTQEENMRMFHNRRKKCTEA